MKRRTVVKWNELTVGLWWAGGRQSKRAFGLDLGPVHVYWTAR